MPAQAVPQPQDSALWGYICGWQPRAPQAQRIIVDLLLDAGNSGRTPNADDIRAIQAAGGRVLYKFRVALLRAELDTGAVRALVAGPTAIANAAWAVHDTSRIDADVQIFYKRAITEADKADLRRLGVDSIGESPDHRVIESLIPDSLIPRVAALSSVDFVRATGWGCAAPSYGEHIRRP
jgi:hypothetical protein